MPDILIAPQRGTSNNPQIFFTGSVQSSASIRMEVLPEGQVAFLGKSGSLFSITDSVVGSLMAVSDISGLPILEVSSDDKVVMGKFNKPGLTVTGSQVIIGASSSLYNGSGYNYSLVVGDNYGTTGYIGVIDTSDAGLVLDCKIFDSVYGLRTDLTSTNGSVALQTYKGSGYGNGSNYILYYVPGATAASDTLQFQSGGSMAMTINGSQNIAIGKTTPINAKLDVNGNVAITGSLSTTSTANIAANSITLDSSAANFNCSTTNINSSTIVVGNDSTDTVSVAGGSMYFNGTGNVGVGKTTPINSKLDVSGNTIISGSLNVTSSLTVRGTTNLYGVVNSFGTTNSVNIYSGLSTGIGMGASDVNVDIGVGRSADGNAYLNFVSDTATYPFYGLLVARLSGANGKSQLIHRGTGDFEIKANEASAISLQTSGTEKVRITSGGNVGIGKSTPNSTLDVNGNTIITGSLTVTSTINGTASNASLLNSISAVNLFNNMGDSHGTRTSFDATTPSYGFGNRFVQGSTNGPGTGGSQFYSWYLGLGSDYPSTGAGSYGAMFAIDRNSSTPYLSVRFNEANSFSSWYKIRAGNSDTTSAVSGTTNYIPKFTSTTAIGNSAIYDSSGAIGIGLTSNIRGILHVNASNYGESPTINKALVVSDSANSEKYLVLSYHSSPDNGVIQGLHQGTAWKDVAINPNGANVSIGKFNPNAKLDVSGNVTVTGSLAVTSTSDSAIVSRGGALFGPNTTWSKYLLIGGDGRQNYTDSTTVASVCTTNGNLHIDAASGFETYVNWYDGSQFRIGAGDSSATRFIINSSGNVGIGGTTTPNGKLDVNGNAVVTGSITSTGDITSNTTMYAQSFVDAGDIGYYCDPNSVSRLYSIRSDYYADTGGTHLFKMAQTSGATRHLNLSTDTTDPSTATCSTGISWGSRSDSSAYYIIRVSQENWNSSGNYNKLELNWHTGIKIGASTTYGGTRFYDNSPGVGGNEIFSVGKGDGHVRVVNNAIITGSLIVTGDVQGDFTPMFLLMGA